jgi:hypothetical protein
MKGGDEMATKVTLKRGGRTIRYTIGNTTGKGGKKGGGGGGG